MAGPAVAGRLLALALLSGVVACQDAAAPVAPASLTGRWVAVDTTHNAYTSAFDGSHRVRAWINSITMDFTATSDSTWTFHAVVGTQTTFDSIAGQGYPPQFLGMIGLHGDAYLIGDTAYVTYLGKLDMSLGSEAAIAFQRTLPNAECMAALGGLANSIPAPTCREAHHWSRP